MTDVYLETEDGGFTFEGMSIPNSTGNRHYRKMQEDVASGAASITAFDHAAKATQDAIDDERTWRNAELAAADINLNIVQDGGAGTVQAWRDYRNELRDWPADPSFPNEASRPVSP